MATVTEVVFLPLKQQGDAQSERFHKSQEVILKTGKPHRMYSGGQIEHPLVQNFFIDWTDVDHHMNFAKEPEYKPFLDDVIDQCSPPPHYYHVQFDSAPTPAFSEVTEFIQVYFPADYSKEDQKKFHDDMKKFGGNVDHDWDDCRGTAGGWVIEEQDEPKSGAKARVYVLFIGWKSVEAHMSYRETQSFKDNIHLLRGGKDLKNLVMFHVASKEFKG